MVVLLYAFLREHGALFSLENAAGKSYKDMALIHCEYEHECPSVSVA